MTSIQNTCYNSYYHNTSSTGAPNVFFRPTAVRKNEIAFGTGITKNPSAATGGTNTTNTSYNKPYRIWAK